MSSGSRRHPAAVPMRFGDASRAGSILRLVTPAPPLWAAVAFGASNRVKVLRASQAFPGAAGGDHERFNQAEQHAA